MKNVEPREGEVVTPRMEQARAKLKSLPDDYFTKAPSRDKRRDIILLMKRAGYGDLVMKQIEIWNNHLARKKSKKPSVTRIKWKENKK